MASAASPASAAAANPAATATRRLLAAVLEGKTGDEIKRMVDRMGQGNDSRRDAILNPDYETPLQAAHRLARHDAVAALLLSGASPSQLHNGEATALAVCCADGNVDGVRALLVAGHDPEETTTNFWRKASGSYNAGLRASHVCAIWTSNKRQTGQLECLRVLVQEANADINAVDKLGQTPLHMLMHVGSLKDPRASVDALLALGADLEAARPGGRTALFQAARLNCLPMVAAMLDAGASAGVRADDGASVLMDAVRHNKTRDRRGVIEELLRRSSPETRRAVDSNGDSAIDLMVAAKQASGASAFESWQLQVIVELRESGAPVKRASAGAIKLEDDGGEGDDDGQQQQQQRQQQAGKAADGGRGRARDEAADNGGVAVPATKRRAVVVVDGGEGGGSAQQQEDEEEEEREKRERRRELAKRLQQLEEEYMARAREIKTEMHEL
jgi:ankyrin repeat protein